MSDHNGEIESPGATAACPSFWRSAPAPARRRSGAVPLYLHGVPTSSDEWVAPLEHRAQPLGVAALVAEQASR